MKSNCLVLLAGVIITCLVLVPVSASMISPYTFSTPVTGLMPEAMYFVTPTPTPPMYTAGVVASPYYTVADNPRMYNTLSPPKETYAEYPSYISGIIPLYSSAGKTTTTGTATTDSEGQYVTSPYTVDSLSSFLPSTGKVSTTGTTATGSDGRYVTSPDITMGSLNLPLLPSGKIATTDDSTATGTSKRELSGTEYDYDVRAGLEMDQKCAPVEVVLTDKSSASGGLYPVAWEWNLGDGTTLYGETVTHTYTIPKTYTLTETVTFSDKHVVTGPPATLEVTECEQKALAQQAAPSCTGKPNCGSISPRVVPNEAAAPDGNVEFSVISTITDDCGEKIPVTFLWDFGDGETSGEISGRHYYKNPGTYTVSFTIESPEDCTREGKTWDITIPEPKIVSVAEPVREPKEETACRDTCWDNGPVVEQISSSPATSFTAVLPGKGLDTAGVSASEEKTITYSAEYGGAHYCSDDSYTSYEFEYLWDFGDEQTSTAPGGQHTYSKPGDYTVRMTATPQGESPCPGFEGTVDTVHISEPPEYIIDFSADPLFGTAPLAVTFTDHSYSMQDGTKSDPIAWDWNLGEGTTKTKKQFTHIYQDPGTYQVTLTVTYIDGTTKSDTKTVTVEEPKDRVCETYYHAELVPDKTGGEADLTVSFADASYATCGVTVESTTTDTGDGNSYEIPSFSNTYTKPGMYAVVHTVTYSDKHQKKVRGIITVTGETDHTVSMKVDPLEGQRPLEISGVDHSSATNGVVPVRWSWDFGDESTGTGKIIRHTYTEAGSYDVTEHVTFSDGYEGDSEVATVTVTGKVTGGWEVEETGTSEGKERTVACNPDWQASATGSPLSGPAELSVSFVDRSYATCDITPTSWDWDFGDGETGSGKTVSHTYTKAGTYDVIETVTFSDKKSLDAEPIQVIVGEEEKEGFETGGWEITERKEETGTKEEPKGETPGSPGEAIPELRLTELPPHAEAPPEAVPLSGPAPPPPPPPPVPTPAPTPTPGQSPTSDCIELNIFEQTNDAYAGGDYTWDNELVAAARAHSQNMCNQGVFSHELDGQMPWDRLDAAGYTSTNTAENIIIACGTDCEAVATDAMTRWLASTGHRNNIMNVGGPRSNLGVGAYQCPHCPAACGVSGHEACCGGGACYLITQVFAQPGGTSGHDNVMPDGGAPGPGAGVDTDGDGNPDATDPDDDGDGIPDGLDPDHDADGDGVPDITDPDDDGDGIPDGADPDHDTDGDGIPDATDPDDDGDGIPDGADPDADGDGIPDADEPGHGPAPGGHPPFGGGGGSILIFDSTLVFGGTGGYPGTSPGSLPDSSQKGDNPKQTTAGTKDTIVWAEKEGSRWVIKEYNTKTGETLTMPGSGDQKEPAISGDFISWTGNEGMNIEVYLYNLKTGELISTEDPNNQMESDVDGKYLVFVDYDPMAKTYQISLYHIETGDMQVISPDSASKKSHPKISDGVVVWEDERNGSADIYLYDLKTGAEQAVTLDAADQRNPDISDSRIVWEDERNGNTDIYLYDIASGTEKQVSGEDGNQVSPSIYGDMVVWQDDRNGNADIYFYDITSGEEFLLTDDTTGQTEPDVYEDGVLYIDKDGTAISILVR